MLRGLLSGFISLPIRIQLLTLIAFLMLPVLGLAVYSQIDQRADAIRAASVSIHEAAEDVANEKQQLVAGAQQLANALSQLPAVRHRDAAALQPLLSRILRLNAPYTNIAIAGLDGNFWVSALPMPTTSSVADRRYFINAVATGRFSSGEYAIGKLARKPTLGFGHPVFDERGKLNGVIVIILDLESFQQVSSEVAFPSGTCVLLVDHKGTILARALAGRRWTGKRLPPDLFRKLTDTADGSSFRSMDLDHVERLSFLRKVRLQGEDAPYLYIQAGVPVAAVLEKVHRTIAVTTALLTAILAAGVALIWFIGKRSILDRVRALEFASVRVAEGDLEVRVADTLYGGELGRLGRAFEVMAQHIATREREMTRARDALKENGRMLQQLNHRLESAREEERHRIAREIHDVMGQSLTALKLDISWLLHESSSIGPEAQRRVNDMLALTDSVIAMVQSIAAELSPPLLEMGLAEAIEWHAKQFEARSGVSCLMMLDETTAQTLDKEDQRLLFRIFQEALTNAIRHSGASEIGISLCATSTALIMEIADNGKGITAESLDSPTSIGLLGMKERAEMCGGALSIAGSPDAGTVVKVQLPRKPREGNEDEEDPGNR